MKGSQFERKLTFKERGEIKAFYLKGYSLSELSKEYSVDRSTIRYYVKDIKDQPREVRDKIQIDEKELEKVLIQREKRRKEIELNKMKKSTPKGKTMMYVDYQRIENEKKK